MLFYVCVCIYLLLSTCVTKIVVVVVAVVMVLAARFRDCQQQMRCDGRVVVVAVARVPGGRQCGSCVRLIHYQVCRFYNHHLMPYTGVRFCTCASILGWITASLLHRPTTMTTLPTHTAHQPKPEPPPRGIMVHMHQASCRPVRNRMPMRPCHVPRLTASTTLLRGEICLEAHQALPDY